MKVPLLDLKAQYAGLKDEISRVIEDVCDSQQFILGQRVAEFEKAVAAYCGTEHAIGVSSGTDALLVSLMAMGIGRGDAVITTPYTFFATMGSIIRLGATPVFVDISPDTYNMDPGKLAEILDNWPKRFSDVTPKAVIPVHLFGQMADMDRIMAACRKHGLKVIEDACQAIGAVYPSADGEKKAGSVGETGCFSFFPSKNLGGFGDGGMVVTNDEQLAETVRLLRGHGADKLYHHKLIGGNFRLDALQAAVLSVKLEKLEGWHEARRENAAYYNGCFEGAGVVVPSAVYEGSGVRNFHIYNQYVIRVKNRDSVMAGLKKADIGCAIYYPVPLHMQECIKNTGYREGDFPESEKAARETLALPVYPELTHEMQDCVVERVLASL